MLLLLMILRPLVAALVRVRPAPAPAMPSLRPWEQQRFARPAARLRLFAAWVTGRVGRVLTNAATSKEPWGVLGRPHTKHFAPAA